MYAFYTLSIMNRERVMISDRPCEVETKHGSFRFRHDAFKLRSERNAQTLFFAFYSNFSFAMVK